MARNRKSLVAGLGDSVIEQSSKQTRKPASDDTQQTRLRANSPKKLRKVLGHRVPLDVHKSIDEIYLELALEIHRRGDERLEKHDLVEQLLRLGLQKPDALRKALFAS